MNVSRPPLAKPAAQAKPAASAWRHPAVPWNTAKTQIETFADILLQARGPNVASWEEATYNTGLQWAVYMEQVMDSLPDSHHEAIIADYLALITNSNPCLQRCGLTSALLACARHALLRSLLQNAFLQRALLPKIVRDYVSIADEDPSSKKEAKQRLAQVQIIALTLHSVELQELGRRIHQQSVARSLQIAHEEVYSAITEEPRFFVSVMIGDWRARATPFLRRIHVHRSLSPLAVKRCAYARLLRPTLETSLRQAGTAASEAFLDTLRKNASQSEASAEIVLWTLLQREDRAAAGPDALAINLQILDWIVRNVDGELIASLHPRFLAEMCAAYWPFFEFLVRKLLSRMTRLASLYVGQASLVGVSDARVLAEVELCWMYLLHQNERLCLACREILLACPVVVVQERNALATPQT